MLGLLVAPAEVRKDAGRFLGRLLTQAAPMTADEAASYIAHLETELEREAMEAAEGDGATEVGR